MDCLAEFGDRSCLLLWCRRWVCLVFCLDCLKSRFCLGLFSGRRDLTEDEVIYGKRFENFGLVTLMGIDKVDVAKDVYKQSEMLHECFYLDRSIFEAQSKFQIEKEFSELTIV